MNIYEILIISISLAMDAFAYSICIGTTINKVKVYNLVYISSFFGLFQCIMPIIGYYLGNRFVNLIFKVDHWICFIILAIIGINMIKESFDNNKNISIKIDKMLIASFITSIDALTIGITFSILKVNLYLACLMIGLTAFIFTMFGVNIGNQIGNKIGAKSQIIGGIGLIIIGFKILLEHLYL